MKRTWILFLLMFSFVLGNAQTTQYFEVVLLRTNGTPLTGATAWLVPVANVYPNNRLALTAHPQKLGVYYRNAVPIGLYDIWVDQAHYNPPGATVVSGYVKNRDSVAIGGAGTVVTHNYYGFAADEVTTTLNHDSTISVKDGGITWEKLASPVADTTTLKSTNADVAILKTVVSGKEIGGGMFVKIDSTYPEGVVAFKHPVTGKQWVREEYLQTGAVNVRWAGAIGDGLNNDYVAIKRAYRSLQTTGLMTASGEPERYGILFFPPGTFIIDSTLRISGGVTLVGSPGFRRTIIKFKDAIATTQEIFIVDTDMRLINGEPFANATFGISIRDMSFIGNSLTNPMISGVRLLSAQLTSLDRVNIAEMGLRGLVVGDSLQSYASSITITSLWIADCIKGPGLEIIEASSFVALNLSVEHVNMNGSYLGADGDKNPAMLIRNSSNIHISHFQDENSYLPIKIKNSQNVFFTAISQHWWYSTPIPVAIKIVNSSQVSIERMHMMNADTLLSHPDKSIFLLGGVGIFFETYPLIAQGNVGIGMVRATKTLQVAGTAGITGNLYLGPGLNAYIGQGADPTNSIAIYSFRPDGISGAQKWELSLGGAGSALNPSTTISSSNTDNTNSYTYIKLGRAMGGPYTGYNILLDPDGTTGVFVGNNLKVQGNVYLNSDLVGNDLIAGTSFFSGTDTLKVITISGGTLNDIYTANSIGNAVEALSCTAITNGVEVRRRSGGVSGLSFTYQRIKR
jgi:hypothetical protein